MKKLCYILGSALLTLIVAAVPASADHHFMQIKEVFLGTSGGSNEDAQFIELRTTSAGQQNVNGHQVKLYNAVGTLVETATFTSNADSASGANAPILAATEEAETMFGVTADVEFDAQNIRGGGKACFESTVFFVIDCVAWGNYSGPASGVGAPFSPAEGIPLGAAILRSSDTNVSRNDFAFAPADPNGGGTPTALQVIEFLQTNYTLIEGDTASVTVLRSGVQGIQVVDFITFNGSATAGSDYTDDSPDPKLQFSDGQNERVANVTTAEDPTFEGDETVWMRVRLPTNKAILGSKLNATLTIEDDDADTVKPKSRVTKPKHNSSFRAAKLMKFKGTADDGPGTLNAVQVALRRTLKNGKCQWLGLNWAVGPCGQRIFSPATGKANWTFSLAQKLKKSRGTNVKFYTVYSSASDNAGNTETSFKKGRNANQFEIK